jgi:hypothetical protein
MVIVYCFVFIDVALGDHSKVGVANGGGFHAVANYDCQNGFFFLGCAFLVFDQY